MVMSYVFPIVTTACMLAMPASLQLTFACTSFFSLIQMSMLRKPGVRAFLQIQPLYKPRPPPAAPYTGTVTRYQAPSATSAALPPPAAPKGVLGGAISDIKGAASQVVQSAKKLKKSAVGEAKASNRRHTEAELRKAAAYEQRRQRELVLEKEEVKMARRERKMERRQVSE